MWEFLMWVQTWFLVIFLSAWVVLIIVMVLSQVILSVKSKRTTPRDKVDDVDYE